MMIDDDPLDAANHGSTAIRVKTLFVTDAELIQRLGVPEKIARASLRFYDDKRQHGFPRKDPLGGNRRYWPAVVAWFDKQHRVEELKL